ncbi:hypothetical protein HWV23_02600 [Natronomonas halophila]|uniref:hypothetical protein n=1 Tax=Natronomonas halophila TaxID=2747817 RepID=UPI0015B3D829|nr:hypothetical protein [Natronomonas halophila]QLD84646.1 hypothetical protein HWV23_02600 [Natronomonas halophila]
MAAGLGVISTFLTAIMIPVMVGTIVYQAVSGNIIDYPTQHLIGVAAGILVATIVFWLVAGLVVAAARTLASTLFEEAEGVTAMPSEPVETRWRRSPTATRPSARPFSSTIAMTARRCRRTTCW